MLCEITKLKIRYNQKRVDNFARKRMLVYVFKPLKDFFRFQSKVRKAFQKHTSRFVLVHFKAWAERTKYLHTLRISVIDNWKGYSRMMVLGPFVAWSQYVRSAKNHMAEQIRIVNSYLRWKWRQNSLGLCVHGGTRGVVRSGRWNVHTANAIEKSVGTKNHDKCVGKNDDNTNNRIGRMQSYR